ncbi:MAG TPA: GvpL/GvpF family gas vesicle protein [Streptosporangiaceae bacterium]|nr:GvpL/GvpF family gas vesicle protein [Streptosporangiaceae bacterium]
MIGAYVYGIVPARTPAPADLTGIDGRSCQVTGSCGAIAAIVSPTPAGRPLGTAGDLRTHARVVEAAARSSAILPLQFGAVMADNDAVHAELLEPYQEEFADRLARLRECDQFTVKGRYEGDVALREVVAEEPDIRRLSERLRDRDEVASRGGNIQLGEMVARALECKREADAEVVAEALAEHAAAMAEHPSEAPDVAADMAFLVPRARQRGFEGAAEALAHQWQGRIRLRLVGPLPPYDFTQW